MVIILIKLIKTYNKLRYKMNENKCQLVLHIMNCK